MTSTRRSRLAGRPSVVGAARAAGPRRSERRSLLVPQDPRHLEALPLLLPEPPTAPRSAVSPGVTTSSRNTLVSGSAWEVGGVSSSATPLMEATDSRITDSWGARWSSSASVRSIRARFARWAISSLVIEGPEELVSGMPTILGEATDRSAPHLSGESTGGAMARQVSDEAFSEFVARRVAGAVPDGVPAARRPRPGGGPGADGAGQDVRRVAERPGRAGRTGVTPAPPCSTPPRRGSASARGATRCRRRRCPRATTTTDFSDRPAVLDALAQLPPRQRAVVVLRYYEDLSVAETAHALGCQRRHGQEPDVQGAGHVARAARRRRHPSHHGSHP